MGKRAAVPGWQQTRGCQWAAVPRWQPTRSQQTAHWREVGGGAGVATGARGGGGAQLTASIHDV